MKIKIQFSINVPPFIEENLSGEDVENRLEKYREAMRTWAITAATKALVEAHNHYKNE